MRKLLMALAVVVGAVLTPAVAASATSPAANYYYPQDPSGGLGTSFSIHYQIVGTAQHDYFSRTIYNDTAVNDLIYSKMCGPTFGCAWAAHYVPIGSTANLTIGWGNWPVGTYTFCVYKPNWGQHCNGYGIG